MRPTDTSKEPTGEGVARVEHPDLDPDNPRAANEAELSAAYELLSDAESRRAVRPRSRRGGVDERRAGVNLEIDQIHRRR